MLRWLSSLNVTLRMCHAYTIDSSFAGRPAGLSLFASVHIDSILTPAAMIVSLTLWKWAAESDTHLFLPQHKLVCLEKKYRPVSRRQCAIWTLSWGIYCVLAVSHAGSEEWVSLSFYCSYIRGQQLPGMGIYVPTYYAISVEVTLIDYLKDINWL